MLENIRVNFQSFHLPSWKCTMHSKKNSHRHLRYFSSWNTGPLQKPVNKNAIKIWPLSVGRKKNWIPQYTFPETNILVGPENRPSKKNKTNLIFQPLIFSSYASFRKSIQKLIAKKYPASYIYQYVCIILNNICTYTFKSECPPQSRLYSWSMKKKLKKNLWPRCAVANLGVATTTPPCFSKEF